MVDPQATTTERGLGWEHQRERARLLPYAYGKPCPRCGRTMRRGQALDLGHVIDRAYGGHNGPRRIEHARCNRQAGAAIANRHKRGQRTPQRNSQNW